MGQREGRLCEHEGERAILRAIVGEWSERGGGEEGDDGARPPHQDAYINIKYMIPTYECCMVV